MQNPNAPGGYPEFDDPSPAKEIGDASTAKEVSDSQPRDRSLNRPILYFLEDGERAYMTPNDLTVMTRRPTPIETVLALTVPPRAAKADYSLRIDRDGQATSIKAPLKNSHVGSGSSRLGAARARRTPRPLGLVPRLTRSLTEHLRPAPKVSLMGVRIDRVTERQVIARVIANIRDGRGGWIVTPNVDHLRIISKRPDLLAMLSEASLMVADGMPLVWASRLRGTPLPERVTGAGLILSLTAAASKAGASIFLLGGNPGDGEAAAAVLKRLNPALKVAGILCPPLGFHDDPLQMTEIGNALHSAKPDIVYSCFGFPKEQLVIHALRHHLPSAWFLGLGGSFAMVSGRTPRAPRWMQRIGMEWFWRLGLEPRRLFHRYILNDLPFAIRLLVTAAVQR
jgi:N-acetylglucosaminyldiphosphoundecaprenol N-acetyl-beta-D-mannosaminyltransferase